MSFDPPRPQLTPEEMCAELIAAGYIKVRGTVWRSPGGCYYRGPYEAWRHMRGIK